MGERALAPIDLNDAGVFARGIPHAAFAEMRRTPGLVWTPPDERVGAGFWSVTRYDDLVAVSRDTGTYSSAVGHVQIYDIDPDALEARASMIDLDPPRHTRLRRLVSSAFTPGNVTRYRSAIRARVTRALDRLEAGGGGDWVSSVAAPIPIGVICDLMGVPEADHRYMIELSDHLVAGTANEPLEPTAYGNTTDLRLLPFNSPAASAMAAYANELAERRRREPADDLMTRLIAARLDPAAGDPLGGDDGPQRLSEPELANFFRLMIFAGNETTRSSIAHLPLLVDRHPEVFDAIGDDPSPLDPVTDEVIRHSSPILYFRRTVTRDCELAGTSLAPGDKIVMWYASANFDETVFADPLAFRADRPATPMHVAFGGGGPHFCLGAALARLEVSELIAELLRRRLRFTSVADPTHVESNFVNGIAALDVSVARDVG